MKPLLLFLTLSVLLSVAKAQPRIDTVDAATLSKGDYQLISDKNEKFFIESRKKSFSIYSKKHYVDSKRKDKATVSYYGNATLTRALDCDTMELAASLITPQNANNYMYHVVLNDSVELIPWGHPKVFKRGKNSQYAYLGKFAGLNKIIKLEMYELHDYKNRAILFFNSNYKPQPILKLAGVALNDKNLFVPDMQVYIPYKKIRYYQPNEWAKKPISIESSDSLNHISITMKNTLQNDIYHVYLKRTIDNKTDTVFITANWEIDYHRPDPLARISSANFNKAGDYEIIVRPEIPSGGGKYDKGEAATIPFTVLPPEKKDIPLKTAIAIILTLMTATAIMFALFRNKQKRKLAHEAQNRQIATLQLQSVRSQLNPHFIFNALAGIQNLINKNAIEDANKYLTRFARLTRNVLDDGQKDLISIEQETKLLDDYLQMEQTRFGFNFNISVDEKIDQQIEIPAMLLQPFVENAVKHGISALKEKGRVDISISESNKDILLKVQDNGKGFNNQQTDGKGIKLCRKRIELFNSIYKNTLILLHIKPADDGTLIVIELKNWQ